MIHDMDRPARLKTFASALVASIGLAILPAAADAAIYQFSYAGSGIATGGLLTTSDVAVGGRYAVTSLIGYRNGVAIDSLLPVNAFVNNDNQLSTTTPYLTTDGISYSAGGGNYNFYFDNFPGLPCGGPSYEESTGGNCLTTDRKIVLELKPFVPTSAAFYFAYEGNGVSATGVLTTSAAAVGGAYQVFDILGSRNGIDISGLLAPGGFVNNDNLLSMTQPFLTTGGISYAAGGASYNFYYDAFPGAPCGVPSYEESTGGNCLTTDQRISLQVLPIFLPNSVPEGSVPGLVLAGIAGFVAATWLRRRRPVALGLARVA